MQFMYHCEQNYASLASLFIYIAHFIHIGYSKCFT